MLGFMPGFPYLGGLDEQLHTPRRNQPRLKIHAGSVGIANNQTGLYQLRRFSWRMANYWTHTVKSI